MRDMHALRPLTRRAGAPLAVAAALVLGLAVAVVAASALPADTVRALETSPYVYVASERQAGGFGTPAEIWFMWDGGAVWVATPATTWRARRLAAGRKKARIAVGSRSGPTFDAVGAVVKEPAAYERLYRTLAAKYPQGWKQYEERFRAGLADGSRVLIRYDPGAVTPSPASATTK
jgi:hypothetical protein